VGLFERVMAPFSGPESIEDSTVQKAKSICERGFWLLSCNCISEAREQFKLAIRSNPYCADGHYGIGLCSLKSGDRRGALKEFQRTVDVDPRHCEARNSLAEELIASGETIPAMKELVAAHKCRPDFLLTHLNMAYLYYTMGSYSEGIKAATKALSGDPRNPRAHYILGLIYIDLQDICKAVFEREILEEIEPETAHLLQVEIDKEFILNRRTVKRSEEGLL
jgi:Tfp pilus assembly protein PilF